MDKRKYLGLAAFVGVLAALGVASSLVGRYGQAGAAAVMAPKLEVDPMWPKPLPNHWVIGAVIGLTADANDHIWIIHRQGALEAKE